MTAPLPADELERLRSLMSYDMLDTAADSAFDQLTELAAKLLGCPVALITLIDENRQWFKSRVGVDVTETPRDLAFCAHAILDPQHTLVVTDATKDARFADNPLVTGDPNIRFYAGAPLTDPNGHALGTLCVIDTAPRTLDPIQQNTLTILAQAIMATFELRKQARQAQSQALTDPLTRLANRAAFRDQLTRAISRQKRDHRPFSLLYLDLDGFKAVNDQHGHDSGDQVLCNLAAILKSGIRGEDMAARIGGDEFSVILAAGDTADIIQIGDRLCETIRTRMQAAGWAVTASIGIATFRTPPQDDAAAMAQADRLMYAAKQSGKNRTIHNFCD